VNGRHEACGRTMKMHVLSGGRLRVSKAMYDAAAPRGETLDVPVSCILLRHRQGNVLFDTGCHPAVAENAEARWGKLAKVMTPTGRPGDNAVSALAAATISTWSCARTCTPTIAAAIPSSSARRS
jgi:hypothetical protein